MGCVFSRQDYETNPRIFHVWNVDGDGRPLKPGKIEVTDTQLILYQKENIVVRWPLTSLRRYGFDSELFSFECGRRCTTGAGVYAFKCRRAQTLFSILQECINNSGGTGGGGGATTSIEDQISLVPTGGERINSLHSSSSLPNGSLLNAGPSSPTVDSSGYLEPITANTHLHYQAPSSTVARNNGTASPGGYVCIHGSTSVEQADSSDWPGLSPSLPSCCSLGPFGGRSVGPSNTAHHYANNEATEGCSNSMCIVNQYVNSSAAAADYSRRCCSPTRCCLDQTESTYVNSAIATLSPAHLPCHGMCCAANCTHCVDLNTNYAKLDDLLKQEQSAKRHKEQHFYVNVKPDYVNVKPDQPTNSGSSASSKCVSGRSTPTEGFSRCGTLTSPASPGSAKVHSSHCYANLGSPATSEPKFSKEQAQVNYVVLDLDQVEAGAASTTAVTPVSAPNSIHSLTSSPIHSPEGYAQIDFDKTVALSNSANPCPAFNDDSIRKTRHNAVIPCASMSA